MCSPGNYASNANGDPVECGGVACQVCRAGSKCEDGIMTSCTEYQFAADNENRSVDHGATQCLSCPAGYFCKNGQLGDLCGIGGYSYLGDGECSSCSGDTISKAERDGCTSCHGLFSSYHLFLDDYNDVCTESNLTNVIDGALRHVSSIGCSTFHF